jgi:hypothetical protein
MSRIQKILDEIAAPSTLKEMDSRLGEICDALVTPKGVKPGAGRDHQALTDLMMYVEIALGEKSLIEIRDEYPATDPLTMISTAEKYKVIPREQARRLRDEFMTRVNTAAGQELTPAQAKNLFRLFRNYDPVPKLKL